MEKKYVNGYDKPQFKLVDSIGNEEIIQLSFKYQALKEYYEKKSKLVTLIDGAKKKKTQYVDYEWRLFYTDYIEKDDLLKIRAIENGEIQGKKIFLTPHIDYPWRIFEVLVSDDKREIDIHYHHRGNNTTANKGYEITFINAKRISEVNMADPDYIPVTAAASGEEF